MNESQVKKGKMGRLCLFIAALIWGTSFIVMKNALDGLPVFYLLALRFTGAALVLSFALFGKKLSRGDLWGGALMGVIMFFAYVPQTFGLKLTEPGKNAFLTASYCVMVPFLYWFAAKRRPDRYNLIAAFICLAGIGFISLTSTFTIVIGDFLTLIGGFFFAAHIVAVSLLTRKRDPLKLTVVQFYVAAALSWAFAAGFETFPNNVSGGDALAAAYLAFFATAATLLLQGIGQKHTPPSSAALILSLEAVFGAVAAFIFYGEALTARLLIGFALIFASVVIAETKLDFMKKLKRDEKLRELITSVHGRRKKRKLKY